MIVTAGIDRLRNEGFASLAGQRVGLMTNPSAVNQALIRTYDILRQAPNVQLKALFGPEHGFAAAEADAAHVGHSVDRHTGAPIYSLYGDTFRPTPDMLGDIDVLVCDIQDVGVRFYTYIWTISYILEACGDVGIPVMILDRPNPLGDTIAGPPLEAEFASFVGRYNIPIQHGMTIGELAHLINRQWNPTPAALTIIRCQGWRRQTRWPETGLPFVTPSPAMPHYSTVTHYPGACLIEGTDLSEGRGTALPFEIVGAPYIDAEQLANELNASNIDGVVFRPHAFQPTDSKYQGQMCFGVQAHVTQADAYQPIIAWLTLIWTIRQMYPEQFSWRSAWEAGSHYHFDQLVGSDKARHQIDAGESIEAITADWPAFCDEFRAKRASYLLYD